MKKKTFIEYKVRIEVNSEDKDEIESIKGSIEEVFDFSGGEFWRIKCYEEIKGKNKRQKKADLGSFMLD